jgi:hypothetical protein
MNKPTRYTTWLHKRTTAERAIMAYVSCGTTELIPHLPKLAALRLPRPTRFNVTVGVSAALLVGLPTIGAMLSPKTMETKAPVVASAPVSKWKNPNVKPFAESPFMDYGTVEWDANYSQWICQTDRHSWAPCKSAEGRTAAQLEDDGFKARAYNAQRDAEEDAKNEYWCGPFEKPEKTGCNSL